MSKETISPGVKTKNNPIIIRNNNGSSFYWDLATVTKAINSGVLKYLKYKHPG